MTSADGVVAALRRFISRGEYGLREVPQLVCEVIDHEYWRAGGRAFAHFQEFVEHDPPEGLGADLKTVKNLCADDVAALNALDRVTTGKHGGDHTSEASKHAISMFATEAEQGTTSQYALRRLRKSRPDLHARVLAQELSPHAAMVQAGFRRRTITLPLDLDGATRALRRHFSRADLTALCALLEQDA